MQRARARWPSDGIIFGGALLFGASVIVVPLLRNFPALNAAMLTAGATWIVFISIFNVLVLNYAPDWVRARVLAVSMLVFQGALAGGSALWGALAARIGTRGALTCAGTGVIGAAVLGLFFRLPDVTVDLTPWVHWKLPIVPNEDEVIADSRPALITVEYEVDPAHQERFVRAMQKYGRVRRRDGAYSWAIYRDLENSNRYVEAFLVDSWAEHLRQHERSIHADRELEERVRSLVHSE